MEFIDKLLEKLFGTRTISSDGSDYVTRNGKVTKVYSTPYPTPTPTQTPAPMPTINPTPTDLTQPPTDYQRYQPQTRLEDVPRDVNALNEIIKSGLEARGNPPIATASADFAEAGSMLPANINPLTAVILSLMETDGGRYMPDESSYNTFNFLSPSRGDWARYKDFRSSLFGNTPEENVNFYDQITESPIYQDFRNSGDVSDLFRRYTPETDPLNPRNYELVDRYYMILDSLMGKIQP
jgi:hypothetical protein